MGLQIVLYCLIFSSAFLGLQAAIGAGKQIGVKLKLANYRLKQLEKEDTPAALIAKMRKDRSIGKDGKLKALNHKIGKLVLQSGLRLGSNGIYFIMIGAAALGAVLTLIFFNQAFMVPLGFFAGAMFPLFVLNFLVKRRRNKAVAQLPEALDVIIRSLKAGHPVPVSISLVGREMPDPIGSEFGIVSDEISFGSDVSKAIQRLADRIGQEDFDLLAAMIRLQERTGGNLVELLASNADTIRQRQKMRMKIRAVSAEGRASALILNAAPIGLFLIVRAAAPDFYGSVDDSNIVKYGLVGIAGWMFIGNLVMRKMINFKV